MKDILTSPRIESIKRKEKARRVRLGILIFILFASLIWALAFFSGNSHIVINKVVVNGTRIINVSDVDYSVRDAIAGKYLHLFARSNSLIYPKSKIYEKLMVDFPRIDELSINRKGWHTLVVDITERAGSYLYCGASIPESESDIGENCYFINNDGYIFDKAPYFSGHVYFKYYGSTVGNTADPLGQQMLPTERFHALARFIDGLIKLGFKPTQLVIGSDEDSIIYLDHERGDTIPKIMFKNDDVLDSTLDNLNLSMAKPEFANEIHSKYTSLLYIDLRFKNKVLYKFQ